MNSKKISVKATDLFNAMGIVVCNMDANGTLRVVNKPAPYPGAGVEQK